MVRPDLDPNRGSQSETIVLVADQNGTGLANGGILIDGAIKLSAGKKRHALVKSKARTPKFTSKLSSGMGGASDGNGFIWRNEVLASGDPWYPDGFSKIRPEKEFKSRLANSAEQPD